MGSFLDTLQRFCLWAAASSPPPTPPPPRVVRLDCQKPRPGWEPRYQRLLVIDDLPRYTQDILETLRVFYEEASLTIHVAHTFADSLAAFKEGDIQLVILDSDLNDPEGSGEDLLKAFKSQEPGVVVLANSSEQRYNDLLLQAGATAALAKEQRKLRRWLTVNGWQRKEGGPSV